MESIGDRIELVYRKDTVEGTADCGANTGEYVPLKKDSSPLFQTSIIGPLLPAMQPTTLAYTRKTGPRALSRHLYTTPRAIANFRKNSDS